MNFRLNTNRLASVAVAVWCSAQIYQRQGANAALISLIGLAGLLSIIWFSSTWAELLRKSHAARYAADRDRPQSGTAVSLIGWILLLLFAAALRQTP